MTLYIVKGQWVAYEPTEIVGIFDSLSKAEEAKGKVESWQDAFGGFRFNELWIDEQILNEIMENDCWLEVPEGE